MKRPCTFVRGIAARWIIVAVIFGLFATTKGVAAPGASTPPGGDAAARSAARTAQTIHAGRLARNQQMLRDESDGRGRVRPDLWRAGIRAQRHLPVSSTWDRGRASAQCGCNAHWVQVGPAPLRVYNDQIYQGAGPDSGEVVDIAVVPRQTKDTTIYIATNDGGIWRTRNGGVSWTPTTDGLATLSMGAVALDPTNPSVVYAGTGNNYDGGRRVSTLPFSKGIGIYRSDDGGDSWPYLLGSNVFTGKNITRIVVPNSHTLLVGTTNGLYKSIDAGAHFGAPPSYTNGAPVLPGNVTDLHLDTNPLTTTAFAAVDGTGIFKSTNLFASAGTNLFNNPGAPQGTYHRISFSQSTFANGAPWGRTMYASVDYKQDPTIPTPSKPNMGRLWKGLFKTTNGGNSWTTPAATNVPRAGCQCDYNLTAGVDPQNPNLVYLGFQELWRSQDGGNTFTDFAGAGEAVTSYQVHWDHHALTFSPNSSANTTRLYVGTDGGIATSGASSGRPAGFNWTNLNEGIATNLLNAIDIGDGSANNQYTYGGAQDTGISEHRPEFAPTDWQLGIDGDSRAVAVDHNDPTLAYGSDNGVYVRTLDGGTSWDTRDFADNAEARRLPNGVFRFGTPLNAHPPNTKGTVFAGSALNMGSQPGNLLYRSTDSGNTFTLITTVPHSTEVPIGIWAIATSPSDPNTLWIGLGDDLTGTSDTGYVAVTHSALSPTPTWHASNMGNVPSCGTGGAPACAHPKGAHVSAIAVDPDDPNNAVVTYPQYCACASGQKTHHVFRVHDSSSGITYSDISGTAGGSRNLPDLPVYSVVIDPKTSPHSIIVSNDAGVLRSSDNGATWWRLGEGLPTVVSTSLAFDYSPDNPVLRVGTYGRSTFELRSG
jgi:photosystem II stability/assembly factor-like uncharacterized protein